MYPPSEYIMAFYLFACLDNFPAILVVHMTVVARVISSFLIVSVFFIPIGMACLLASNDVAEIIDRYDSDCIPENFKNNKVGYIQTCNMTLNLRKTSSSTELRLEIKVNNMKKSKEKPKYVASRERLTGPRPSFHK
ncbi:hypothetical protein K1719_020159 [Acacia pycnantha]|nr:hypothetical protein K1719_020159 [Acacia pycnantha]